MAILIVIILTIIILPPLAIMNLFFSDLWSIFLWRGGKGGREERGEERQGEGERKKEGRQEGRKQILKKSPFSVYFIIHNSTAQLSHRLALFGAATLQFPWWSPAD